MLNRQQMSWAGSMVRHPKAARELQFALQAIQPIMTDPNESRESKRSTLNMMVNELSEDTFKLKPVAEQIMTIINMKEDVCMEYPDTESQVNGILSWLPRFQYHRDLLFREVKKHRNEYKLKS